jgi:hypothetical protein
MGNSTTKQMLFNCNISGSRVGGFLRGYGEVYSGRSIPTYRGKILLSSSGSIYTSCSVALHFDPEDGGNTFLRNVCKLIMDYRHHNVGNTTAVVSTKARN